MEPVEPASFYTGLVAELYATLRSVDPDPEPYARFVSRWGTPALELGCGEGDPLLELRSRGLDVEGLDSSVDMLDRCRSRAAAQGLDVVLHHAAIESMDLGRTYRSIFLAGPTFTLLTDDETALRALRRIAAHLDADGRVLIPLFVPPVVPATAWGTARSSTSPDGTVLRCTTVSVERDEDARLQTVLLRYERIDPDGRVEMLERPWVLHWYTPDGFASLVATAGLQVIRSNALDGTPAGPDTTDWVVSAGRP